MGRADTAKVLATTLLGTMDTNALVPIIALYAAFLGADVVQVGIIVGSYSAVHAPANLLFGRLADRWGRKRPLQIGLAWDAVSLVLYALAGDPLTLALARVSHGLGGGLVGPSTMSLASDLSAPARKGRTMALYGMSIAFAVVLGFGMSGPIVRRAGYDALFYVLALGLVTGLGISTRIREPVAVRERARPSLRAVRAYVLRPGPSAGYASIFSLYFMLGAFTALVPLHLEEELGYGPLEVGLAFTAFGVLSLLLHYPAGILADRFGSTVPTFLGLLSTAAAMAVIPLARDVPAILGTMALFGMGHGFVFPASSALVTRAAPRELSGLLTGLFYAVLVAGVAIGAPVMAAVAYPANYSFGIWASSWAAFLGIGFVIRALTTATSERAADASAWRARSEP
ncbi:MAG: hypothetical protein A3K59_08800 [Euryarchaeota archaeon RBG_19FT_COMBO_69_17]|nr:MAG: hypothetical protein A3K59_08800 [Euryarchaeota archaeon RBG_19FT_COMBO_69_17]